MAPLLQLQQRWSRLPRPGALLLEQSKSRDGYHAYLFPFEGRAVHEGLSALLAYRLARQTPRSLTVTSNDYGFELLSAQPLPTDAESWRRLLSRERLIEDLLASLNAAELDRRQFREIARVAGLVFPGYPGMPRNARQLQASSGLLYDVFVRYDPENLLLDQARREVLDRQLEVARIREALERIAAQELVMVATERLTPLAFPLWADRIQAAQVSTEKWVDKVRRMAAALEEAAARETSPARGKADTATRRHGDAAKRTGTTTPRHGHAASSVAGSSASSSDAAPDASPTAKPSGPVAPPDVAPRRRVAASAGRRPGALPSHREPAE